MNRIELPYEQALVLQHINDSGEEDFTGLAYAMRVGRARLAHLIQTLHRKRLIVVRRSGYAEAWVRLSSRGKRLMAAIWPEAALRV